MGFTAVNAVRVMVRQPSPPLSKPPVSADVEVPDPAPHSIITEPQDEAITQDLDTQEEKNVLPHNTDNEIVKVDELNKSEFPPSSIIEISKEIPKESPRPVRIVRTVRKDVIQSPPTRVKSRSSTTTQNLPTITTASPSVKIRKKPGPKPKPKPTPSTSVMHVDSPSTKQTKTLAKSGSSSLTQYRFDISNSGSGGLKLKRLAESGPNPTGPTPNSSPTTPLATNLQYHHLNPFLYPQHRIRSNPSLDLQSVRRKNDYNEPIPSRKANGNREFNLTEVPTYKPTPEEFKDPSRYIAKIEATGKKYGMVKIIPPKTWDPIFSLDSELFWFKTRRQTINSINGGFQTRLDFVGDLYYFHRKFTGAALVKLPNIDKRPIDLFHLHQCVKLRGGFQEVCRGKLWAQIGRELGYSGKIMTSLSTSLKSAYNRLLFPFDEFIEKHGGEAKARLLLDPPKNVSILDDDFLPYSDTLSLLPGETTDHTSLKRELNMKSENIHATKKLKLRSNGSFVVIHSPDDDFNNLPQPPSVSCSSMPITRPVQSNNELSQGSGADDDNSNFKDWHYGMEDLSSNCYFLKEAPTYNLRQFQNKAEIFYNAHFKNQADITESDVEKEYWKLLGDTSNPIEVEYGADIPTSVHGSGFPQLEHTPRDPYARDPWNLNVLPFCINSIFRDVVDSDIPYLVKPSLSVGMAFSTQSWHFPDFFTGTASYLHFGSTKTWYTVPEHDFEKFQEYLKKELGHDAVKSSPNLLFESNIMISPQTLRENGIQCYAVDQRPGQLVISFPKAHICHFNHGFNLAESVNTAMFQDWLPYGQECAGLYAKYSISPPFSLDRLAFSAATCAASDSVATYVSAVCKQERLQRKLIRSRFSLPEVLEKSGGSSMLCSVTKAYCFLSRIVDADGNVFSLDVFPDLEKASGRYMLVVELSDEELENLEMQMSRKSNAPSQWVNKFKDLMSENPRPQLKTLFDIMVEGEWLSNRVSAVSTLRKFIEEASEWVAEIRNVLSVSISPDLCKKKHDPEYFQTLLDKAQTAAFTCPEFTSLQDRAKEIQRYCNKAERILVGPPRPIKEYEELLEQGNSFNLALPVNEVLSKAVERMRWMDGDTTSNSEDQGNLDLDETNKRIEEGLKLGIPLDNPRLQKLCISRDLGIQLEIRVKKALADNNLQFDDLNSIVSQAKTTPIKNASFQKIHDLYEKHLQVVKKLQDLIDQSKESVIDHRPKNSDALAVLDEANKLNSHPKLPEVERNIRFVNEWLRQGKRIFGKGNAPLHIVGLQLNNIAKRNDACLQMNEYDSNDTEGHKKSRVYCFCHTADNKSLMVTCEVCKESYHKKCLKNQRGGKQLQSQQSQQRTFVCPICDWLRVDVPPDTRPRLEELEDWVKDSETLPFQPVELAAARHIVSRAIKFRDQLVHVLADDDQSSPDFSRRLENLRSYLRRLEGADIIISQEQLDYLRKEVHRLARPSNVSAAELMQLKFSREQVGDIANQSNNIVISSESSSNNNQGSSASVTSPRVINVPSGPASYGFAPVQLSVEKSLSSPPSTALAGSSTTPGKKKVGRKPGPKKGSKRNSRGGGIQPKLSYFQRTSQIQKQPNDSILPFPPPTDL